MNVKNEEVRYYQPRFKKWIDSTKWDSIAERCKFRFIGSPIPLATDQCFRL